MKWFSHAAFAIENGEHTVLVDPFFTGNPLCSIKPDELERVDAIVVTHGHRDHIGDTEYLAKKHDATVISSVEICNWLGKRGVKKLHGQQPGGGHSHFFGTVKFTAAVHSSSLPDGSYGGIAMGVILETGGKRIYHSGDTALFSDMKIIGKNKLDAALLCIGGNYTMDVSEALEAASMLKPGILIPMHYDTWEVIRQDVVSFKNKAASICDVRILGINDTITI
ncbi:MAG: metal-dependent hydrolase [Deltaproteobacteria bacterium]|nr:metal-dependent hydrolase [Deltaproteobacteria bacterium]